MKPFDRDIEAALGSLEIDIVIGKFRTADGLRQAIAAYTERMVREAIRCSHIYDDVEGVVHHVLKHQT